MAGPPELVKTMAEALGMPATTLTVYDRCLSEAGLRSKHGRGRGTSTVTARDAAHLLTAVLMARRSGTSQTAIARALKGARAAGLTIARVEIDPATGRIVIVSAEAGKTESSQLEAWRANRGSR